MKHLYLRIWLNLVAVLLVFGLIGGWYAKHRLDEAQAQMQVAVATPGGERWQAWGDLLQQVLPPPSASPAQQEKVLRDWSERLRLALALEGADGQTLAASEAYLELSQRPQGMGEPMVRILRVALDDGRVLLIARSSLPRARMAGAEPPPPPAGWALVRRWLSGRGESLGLGLPVFLTLLFLGVALAALPVARRLTSRLEQLQRGVERFGEGQLAHRVDASGQDEVARLAGSFNSAAARIEQLVQSTQILLANASHELRSPLARLKMALSLYEDAQGERQARLRSGLHKNIAELDALVEEVLLSSRLNAGAVAPQVQAFDLLALCAEEAAALGADLVGEPMQLVADRRLSTRAVRNLLENARRYGAGSTIELVLSHVQEGERRWAQVDVMDRGPGVPDSERERIFEAFYRMPGHAESAGGVGLGLALVRQIMQAQKGSVTCLARDGGGSCFRLRWPLVAGEA